ncbi:hypothetical protein H2199_008637 [Coniosporium tulheliwenetii]|uniref:Uncharacterized protein n=1 Tax=Coniosporium tulheliwenetii TaxID=3383036 RepID=A0ACC2YIX8_9PEZI|nr:hypothetical protein H2199_008637 [Cladosporium sp. JES 115]
MTNLRGLSKIQSQRLAVRFTNRPNGTPLATIKEQNSQATLKTQQSFPTSKSRFKPRRILSRSLDEVGLRETREVRSDTSQQSTAPTGDFTRPHAPSLPPLIRTKTPPGAPRWPGDLPPTQAQPTPRGIWASVRHFFAPPQPPQRPQRRGRAYWQPPRSAHNSSRLGPLESHPFYRASVAVPGSWPDDAADDPAPAAVPYVSPTAATNSLEALASRCDGQQPAIDGSTRSPPQASHQPPTSATRSRDDLSSRYTASGVPIYRTSASSLQILDAQTHRSISGSSTSSRRGLAVSAPTTARLPRNPGSTDSRSRPAPVQPAESPATIKLQRFDSAALGTLLPIAAAEGIVRIRSLEPGDPDPLALELPPLERCSGARPEAPTRTRIHDPSVLRAEDVHAAIVRRSRAETGATTAGESGHQAKGKWSGVVGKMVGRCFCQPD